MSENQKKPKRRITLAESLIGFTILLILAVVGFSIYQEQFDYDPTLFNLDPDLLEDSPIPAILRRVAKQPSLSAEAVESFDAENVYKKINGRDQAFITRGFVRLDAIALSATADPAHSFEISVYDMAQPDNAFGIFSSLRRDDPPWPKSPALSARAPNALFFVKGRYYVSLIGSDTSAPLQRILEATAQVLLDLLPGTVERPWIFDVLPAENLIERSVGFTPTNFGGTEFFDHVFTASYQVADDKLNCYLSRRTDAAQAQALWQQLQEYWEKSDAKTIWQEQTANIHFLAVELYGRIETAFIRGRYLGGVTQAKKLQPAKSLTNSLARALP